MSISETDAEQQYVDVLYARLDPLRARIDHDLRPVRRAGASGTRRPGPSAMRSPRCTRTGWPSSGVEERLCFGRLDMVGGGGALHRPSGLFDDDQTQLLVDWRARPPATSTRPPRGVPVRSCAAATWRRTGRRVTAIYDDVLDLDTFEARPDLVAHTSESSSLTTDGALLAALNAHRTGRMGDIVATIQSEQDEIVRAPLPGVLVVQGGPGTGKTAVALHRAAYLLYTHRDRLESRGVLLVGPSPVFLRYISQVLPSLGETGVVTATPAELFPGVDGHGLGRRPDGGPEGLAAHGRRPRAGGPAARARSAGRARAEGRQRHAAAASAGRAFGRRDGAPRRSAAQRRAGVVRPHDAAAAWSTSTRMPRATLPDTVDRSTSRMTLRDAVDVRRELNLAWPPLAAEQVLADLFASPERLYAATPGWSNDERVLLLRGREAVDDSGRRAAGRGRRADGEDDAASVGGAPWAARSRRGGAPRPGGAGVDRGTGERPRLGRGARLALRESRDRPSPSPSAPSGTAPGRTATSSSTRRRS